MNPLRFSSFSRTVSLFPEVYMLFPSGAVLPPDQDLTERLHSGSSLVPWLPCLPDIWSMLSKHRWNEGEPAFGSLCVGGLAGGVSGGLPPGDPAPGPACSLPVSHVRLHSALPPGLHSPLQGLDSPTSLLLWMIFPSSCYGVT